MVWLVSAFSFFFLFVCFVISTVSCSSTYKKNIREACHAGVLRMLSLLAIYQRKSMSWKIIIKRKEKKKGPRHEQKQKSQEKSQTIHLAFSVRQNWKCSEDPEEPLWNCSVTTSCVLHLSVAASLGSLQLLVALLLQSTERTKEQCFKIKKNKKTKHNQTCSENPTTTIIRINYL